MLKYYSQKYNLRNILRRTKMRFVSSIPKLKNWFRIKNIKDIPSNFKHYIIKLLIFINLCIL